MSSEPGEINADLVRALHNKINQLEARLDELESGSANTSDGNASGAGQRDSAVIDQLDVGETVSVKGLKQLYRTHTDIRSEKTLKGRVKSLTNRPEFEWKAPGKWRFVGGDRE